MKKQRKRRKYKKEKPLASCDECAAVSCSTLSQSLYLVQIGGKNFG